MAKPRASKIDVQLERLCAHQLNHPHLTYTRDELSALCNCDKELIRRFETRALRKVRSKLSKDDWATLKLLLQSK